MPLYRRNDGVRAGAWTAVPTPADARRLHSLSLSLLISLTSSHHSNTFSSSPGKE